MFLKYFKNFFHFLATRIYSLFLITYVAELERRALGGRGIEMMPKMAQWDTTISNLHRGIFSGGRCLW